MTYVNIIPKESLEEQGWAYSDEYVETLQEKNVTITENSSVEIIPDEGFEGLRKVTVIASVTGYTGHADVEGLKAIGWDDEDIAYYQENGVNWNEEDDEYHKVTDDNKALYGVLTADNISTFIPKARIVYLPKIDTSGVTDMKEMFKSCTTLTAIPMLDTSSVVNMRGAFSFCYALTHIPKLNTSNVTDMDSMFKCCYSLRKLPLFDTRKVSTMSSMFQQCNSLLEVPNFDTTSLLNIQYMFSQCSSLEIAPVLDGDRIFYASYVFSLCYALKAIPLLNLSGATYQDFLQDNVYGAAQIFVKGVKRTMGLKVILLSKESILYIINNEAATSAITITLHYYAYDRWANDADVVAALANHPNISLSK